MTIQINTPPDRHPIPTETPAAVLGQTKAATEETKKETHVAIQNIAVPIGDSTHVSPKETSATQKEIIQIKSDSERETPAFQSAISTINSLMIALTAPSQLPRIKINNLCRNIESYTACFSQPLENAPDREKWLVDARNWLFNLAEMKVLDLPSLSEMDIDYLKKTGKITPKQEFIVRNHSLSERLYKNYLMLRTACLKAGLKYDLDQKELNEIKKLFIDPAVFDRLTSDYIKIAKQELYPLIKQVTDQIGNEILDTLWMERANHRLSDKNIDDKEDYFLDISLPIPELIKKFKTGDPLYKRAESLRDTTDRFISINHFGWFPEHAELRLAQALNSGYFYLNYEFFEKKDELKIYYFFQLPEGEEIEGNNCWSLYEWAMPMTKKEYNERTYDHSFPPKEYVQDTSKLKRHGLPGDDAIEKLCELKKQTNREKLRELREKAKNILEEDSTFQTIITKMKSKKESILKIIKDSHMIVHQPDLDSLLELNESLVFPFYTS